MTAIKKLFNPNTLSLFLVIAFPIHFWSIMMQLYEIQDITLWEIMGRAGYSLTFAFFESCVLFLIFLPLYLLLSKRVAELKSLVITSWAYLTIAIAAISAQIYATIDKSAAKLWYRVFLFIGRFEGISILIFIIFVITMVSLPVFITIYSQKSARFMYKLLEGIATLSIFYLLIDAVGIVVIFIRNSFG